MLDPEKIFSKKLTNIFLRVELLKPKRKVKETFEYVLKKIKFIT